MRDQQRLVVPPESSREELFTQRYNQLLAWALRLTNQQRETAEDLVQDAFIQFTLGRTSLEQIENIDGYLRRMLRYMHLSSLSRNAQKVMDQTFSIAECDSFHETWRAIEPAERMQAQEELCQICAYAASRKETSRAGSVLILRFFHDYYPSEIARVLCCSRHCVDQWQRLARSELKLYLTKPARLKFVNGKTQTKTARTKLSGMNGDLPGELRHMIFNSRLGDCLPVEQLQEIYQLGNHEALTTATLGHVVSCRSCLDLVNQLLGLPLLTYRYQGESSGPRSPNDGSGGGESGGGKTDLPTIYHRRLREVNEHRPKELRIALNGSVAGCLKVGSDCNELDLNLREEGKIEFVEVSSEQGVQLLFMSVGQTREQTAGHWGRIELSEGRSLEIRLSFESGPTLHLIYEEPIWQPVPAPLKIIGEEMPGSYSGTQWEKTSLAPGRYRSKLGRLSDSLKQRLNATLAELKVVRLEKVERTPVASERYKENSEESHLSLFSQTSALIRKPIWARPEFLTALVSLLLLGTLLFFRERNLPARTATSLLQQASLAEEVSSQAPDQVTHRLINLEERRSTDRSVIARRRIEIWQKPIQGKRARRLYDESNRLLAGAWEKEDGSRTIYHHDSRPQSERAPERPDHLLLDLEHIWQLEMSAKEFRVLIGNAEEAQVEERPTSYTISWGRELDFGAIRLLKATLTLSRTDLHVTAQTLLIQSGGEVREYRFVESGFERLPQKSVSPLVFEVEPELAGNDKTSGRSGERTGERIVSFAPPLPALSPSLRPASTELEVDVAYLLNQANGDRNEQVSLSRTPNGFLRVDGLVDTEQRKLELLRALGPVGNNPAVKIEIATVAETMQRKARSSSVRIAVRETEDTVNTIAVYEELRNYLEKTDVQSTATSEGQLDEAVRTFSARTVNRSYRLLFQAIELKRLADRFANVDMRTVTTDARTKWLQMIREHAMAFERENAILRQEIQPIFFRSQSANTPGVPEIASDADLARAIERLHKLALATNETIRAAFTISAKSSNAEIKYAAFWHSLNTAERLAALIRRYQE